MRNCNALRMVALMAATAATCCLSPHVASAAKTIFAEDFEGVQLGPNVDEALAGDEVWAKEGPPGWVVDDSEIPGVGTDNDGVTEWAGWSFADGQWWTETAGDQDRSQFTSPPNGLSSGTVLVADPDEWDDLPHDGAPPWYNAFVTTPVISLAGMVENTVVFDFDSSWRDEFDASFEQTAIINISFNGGAATEILRWESDPMDPDFKDDAPNEHITLALNNPAGATEMTLELGLIDAGNDWWWAVDNLVISGELVPPDVNSDGVVDALDFAVIRDNMFTGTTFETGDVNFDGITNMADFGRWKEVFSEGLGGPPANVPEPGTLSLLGLVALGSLFLRRRGLI